MSFVATIGCHVCGRWNFVKWGSPQHACRDCGTGLRLPLADPKWTDPLMVHDPFFTDSSDASPEYRAALARRARGG